MAKEAVNKDKKVVMRKRLVAKRTLPLFVRLGYEKVSFQDISDATGIPRTALYRYYRTKRQIFDAAILEIISELKDEIAKAYETVGSPVKRLKAVADSVMTLLFRERAFVQVIFDFVFAKIASGEDMARRVSAFTIGLKFTFRDLIIAGQSEGLIRSEINPNIFAELLFSTAESAALKMLLGAEKTPAAGKQLITAAIDEILVDKA